MHAVAAITMIVHASSIATGYDMWEEGELEGPVPEQPVEEKKVEPEASA